jgi:hypothetical protein
MSQEAALLRQAYEKGFEQGKRLLGNELATGAGVAYLRDLTRCTAQSIGWPVKTVVEKVRAFHRERLDAVPDLTVYPELRGYRDRLERAEAGMRDAGVPDDLIAISKTLKFWRDTRLLQETGRAYFAMPLPEKCRILYVPQSDRGALHLKNVDDPLTYWTPRPRHGVNPPWPHTHPLIFDGVGSGLHIDEISPEIFPVEVQALCKEHCTTVEAATEFMVRYNYFWSSQNLLIHDHHGNSMAFEKTRCRVATRQPNAQGINFISGMGALDPEISAHQKRQRQQYLDQQGWSWDDSPDGCFFTQCENKWKNMARYVDDLALNPTFDNAKQLMEQRDQDGPMCLTGEKAHPAMQVAGCTLVMDIYLMDEKKLHRRQWRGNIPAYLDTPEIVQFV